jgi:hypothetical protein
VKPRLSVFDWAELLQVIHDLYAASRDNQAFLHARLDLGSDPLDPYKETISRWICPDVYRQQDYSVSKAKKAISDYKKAVGRPEGMAELTVFFCEEAINLIRNYAVEDEGYYDALVRMFEQAVKRVLALPEGERTPFIERLAPVRTAGCGIGWGVGYAFDDL